MISMPNAYKQSMAQKFRNRSYLLVTVGVINQVAQKDSQFVERNNSRYSYLSSLDMPLRNYDVSLEYATMEQNWTKCDGSMLFPPREKNYLYNQGMMSANTIGSCHIQFGNTYDIRGLTIDFGRNYPESFSISNGEVTQYIYGNTRSRFTTDYIFNGTNYLVITPTKMVNGNNRLRIRTILMGVGISFENSKIINASQSEHSSPIVDDLPTIDFSLTVENYNRMFDVENSDSAINYLEIGQEVQVKYGYDVLGDGNITWIDGCVVQLTDWQADDEKMQFSAKDKISTLDDVYYNGIYSEDGISLYDLAVDVLTDAGFEERDYELDPYLHDVIVHNPIPCVTHKEALQIIANAGRCKLYVTRQGLIGLKSAFLTVIAPDRMEVISDSATEFTNLPYLVGSSPRYDYATFSQDQVKADGTLYFLPRQSPYLATSYVSKYVSDENGLFQINPSFSVRLEASTTYYSLKLNFTSNPPKKIKIITYLEDVLQEEYEVERDFELNNVIEHEFLEFSKITIEFIETRPNTRIFCDSLTFGDVTDYTMDYDVMTSYPKGIQTEKVANIDVIRSIYLEGEEEKNIFTEEIDFTDIDDYTFFFSEASFDIVAYDVTNKDEPIQLSIIESSSYYITVNTASLSGFRKIEIDGKAYAVSNKIQRKQINTTGVNEEWSNPLISDEDHATIVGDWLGNYFSNNVEYDISYRGDPRVENGDIVFLENKYVDSLQIQIYDYNLDFNGALSGSVKAHRAIAQKDFTTSYLTDENENRLINEIGRFLTT